MRYWLVSFVADYNLGGVKQMRGDGVFYLNTDHFLPGGIKNAIKSRLQSHFKQYVNGDEVIFFVTFQSVTEITREGFLDFVKPDVSKVEVQSITWR